MSIRRWIRDRGWLPPETVGPILPGQVWTYEPFNLRWGKRQGRYLVKIVRVEDGAVWFSLIPGPRFQNVARLEPEFRKLYRLVPDVIAVPNPHSDDSAAKLGSKSAGPEALSVGLSAGYPSERQASALLVPGTVEVAPPRPEPYDEGAVGQNERATIWSENPGAFELQLRRRKNNRLFLPHLRSVEEEEIAAARARDCADVALLEERLRRLSQEITGYADHVTLAQTTVLLEELQAFVWDAAGVGGAAVRLIDKAKRLQSSVNEACHTGLKKFPEALRLLNDAESFVANGSGRFEVSIVAQLARESGPVPSEQLAATLITEGPDAIRAVLAVVDSDVLHKVRGEAMTLLKAALEDGVNIKDVEDIVRAFDAP